MIYFFKFIFYRYSGNILRIGHVTGTCTDIGVNTGRYVMGTRDNTWRIQILLTLLITFFLGGFVAQELHQTLGKYQLLLSAGISFFIGFSYLLYLRLSDYHLSIYQAIFGTKEIDLIRESTLTNMDLNSEVRSVFSYEYSTWDDDYSLTHEEALKFHCKPTGELLDNDVRDETIRSLLEAHGNSSTIPEDDGSLRYD